mmetsp:Transcript_36114/g.144349  ORF Transcript_36114/g.144349 Transcript_36114/m.144349 type:complete len:205 (+) Transcript_36114:1923-2537(+)
MPYSCFEEATTLLPNTTDVEVPGSTPPIPLGLSRKIFPFMRSTISFAMYRPNPLPPISSSHFSAAEPLNPLSKTKSTSSFDTPYPVSLTRNTTPCSSAVGASETSIVPGDGVYAIALSTRLFITSTTALASTRHGGASSSTNGINLRLASAESVLHVSTAGRINSDSQQRLISNSENSPSKALTSFTVELSFAASSSKYGTSVA